MALPISYNVRNVRVRWQVTLLAIVGIAMVVAVFAVLLSMSEGFKAALRSTGRTDNAMIVQRGSASELTSGVPLDHRNIIVVDDRVARGPDGQPLAAWDWVIVVSLPKTTDGQPTNVTLRAVIPRAFEVRGGIQVTEGRHVHPRPRRGDRGPQAHGPHPGHAHRRHGEVPAEALPDRGPLRLPGRRLRERDLGRLRHPGRPSSSAGRARTRWSCA